MASVNKVFILGNLGSNPELKSTTSSNTPYVNISVATSRRFKGADGQVQTETEWHRICAFGRTAEVIAQYCSKGSPVHVEGRLRTRKWTDQQGIERYTTEILADNVQLLKSREGDDAPKRETSAPASRQSSAPSYQGEQYEDVPF